MTKKSEPYSKRRKQMLNWLRSANPERLDDFHYMRWAMKATNNESGDLKAAIKAATEDQLEELYILREELRLGI